MKYDLQIEIVPKNPGIPFNLRLDEKVLKEFKTVVKQNGVSMTHVVTKMMIEFVDEYKSKGLRK